MIYHAPQQRLEDGRWNYTASFNDGGTVAIGYCRPFDETKERIIKFVFGSDEDKYEAHIAPFRAANDQGKFHSHGHETAEEACECYKQYQLDFSLHFADDLDEPKIQRQCAVEGCKAMTSGGAHIANFHHYNLCADHRTREIVSDLFSVGRSWTS